MALATLGAPVRAAPHAPRRGRGSTRGRPLRNRNPRRVWASSSQEASGDGGNQQSGEQGDEEGQDKPTIVTRIKNFFFGERLTRGKLASLGLAAVLSYGFVSNVNAITLVIISWVSYAKAQGASPLAPGMWKGYLAAYAALYALVGNALRPVRFSVAVGIYPFFDRLVSRIEGWLKCRRAVAVGVTVFLVNVCGTLSYLCLGLSVACAVTGAPLLPK